MNKRVRELAEQAGFLNKDEESIGYFAELIVQECADIGEQYADGNYEVRNQILSHFGLEEE